MRSPTSAWSYYGSNNYSGRNYNRGTPVATAVVAITAASTIGAGMESNAASARYLGYHSGRSLIGYKRHGLDCYR
jgi:hypothetical protein